MIINPERRIVMPKCKHCGIPCNGEFHDAGCELEYGKYVKKCMESGFKDERCTPIDNPEVDVEDVNEPQPDPMRSVEPQVKVKKRPGRPKKVKVVEDEA